MTNPYYNGGSFPATGAPATSASMRAELTSISGGFDKLPTLSGNANKMVVVNASASALEATGTLPALTIVDSNLVVEDNADSTRKFRFEANSVTAGATRVLTVPDANTTLVGTDAVQTLTNKTINLTSNLFTATSAQLAAAVTDETGSGSLVFGTNPTIGGATLTGGSLNNTPIGGTTPSTGAFTTLTTSSTVTLNGGTANGVLYLNGSKVATSGSALTFDGATVGVATGVANSTSLQITGTYTTNNNATFLSFLRAGGAVAGALRYNDTQSDIEFGTTTSHPLAFIYGGSEQMRLTSTGLGIGTSSPVSRFAVSNGTNRGEISPAASNVTVQALNEARTATTELLSAGSILTYWTGAAGSQSEKMRLDSSGNLGLGVTPSAWGSDTTAIQLGGSTFSAFAAASRFLGLANARWDGTNWRYLGNAFATQYRGSGGTGAHEWYISTGVPAAGGIISFTQAMTLDASGNLGVGITGPAQRLDVRGTTSATIRVGSTGNGGSGDEFGNLEFYWADPDAAEVKAKIYAKNVGNVGPGGGGAADLLFATRPAFGSLDERARITSGGYFKASDDGVYAGAANTWHEFNQSANSLGLTVLADNASFTSSVVEVSAARNTTNNTYYFLDCAVSGVAYRLRVADSGNVTNTNGSYGTISDAKMKTDIVDAGSQWSDIKAIRFRKFKMKDDPAGLVQLGVVAQELEQTSPGLVEEHPDRDAEGNDLGTTTKTVKSSVLLMKAAVALQEAMTRIEQLEARAAALEGV